MFPLFECEYKQMRHEQFIAHTITQRHFPTLRPEPGSLAKKIPKRETQGLGPPQARTSAPEQGPPELQTTAAHTHTHTD